MKGSGLNDSAGIPIDGSVASLRDFAIEKRNGYDVLHLN